MLVTYRRSALALILLGLFGLFTAGCTSNSTTSGDDNHPATKEPNSRDGYAAASRDTQSTANKGVLNGKVHDHSGWWCDEHGLPEEVCDLCSRKFREAEKKKGNWCEHNRVKSSCFKCNPGLQEKWAKEYEKRFGMKPPAPDPDEDEVPKKK